MYQQHSVQNYFNKYIKSQILSQTKKNSFKKKYDVYV